MDKYRIFNRLEPLILYLILYFPALLSNNSNADIYSQNSLIFTYSVISLLHILFLFYFIKLKTTDNKQSGLKYFNLRIIPRALINLIPLFIIVITVNLIIDLFIGRNSVILNRSDSFLFKALAVSFLTGYREEIFFRSYLISASEVFNGKIMTVFISSFLFAISHLSGGIRAVLTAFAAGTFLAALFIKHRNIHINALCHSLYNFSVLFLTF